MCRRLLGLAFVAALANVSAEAAVLQSARATIEILDDGTCDVQLWFVVSSDTPVTSEHRLLVTESSEVDDVIVSGTAAGAPRRMGRTLVVPVSLRAGRVAYDARYRVRQAPGDGWCGLLVPDVATAGVGRDVRVDVSLADGMRRLPGEFPAMQWHERRGSVTLAHVPAFARVPHASPGEDVAWRRSFDVRRVLDTTAIVILVGASVIWMTARRRRR